MVTKVADKRAAILETALKLFTEKGFHGAPTSQIAREAGIGTGTLFHYFKTKEELINKLYLSVKASMIMEVGAGIEKETTLRGKIRRVWLNLLDWGMTHPAGMHFFQQFSASPYITAMTREEAAGLFEKMSDLIRDGIGQEVLKNLPPEMFHNVIGGLFQGTLAHFFDHPEDYRDKGFREQTFTMLWDSIRR